MKFCPTPATCAALAVCAALLGGCNREAPRAEKTQRVVLFTGPEGRHYHTFGEALRTIAKEHNLEIEVVVTPGSMDNLVRLNGEDGAGGASHFAVVQSDVAHRAWHGEWPYSPGSSPRRGLLVMPLFMEKVQILTRPHLFVYSASDLKGKKLWLGKAGSGSELTALSILESAGFAPAELDKLRGNTLEYEQAVAHLVEGRLDAIFQTSVAPADRITRLLAPPSEVRLLPLEQRAVERLTSDGSYVQTSLLRNEYASLGRAVLTVGTQALLLTGQRSSPEAVNVLAGILRYRRAEVEHRMREILKRTTGAGDSAPVALTLVGRQLPGQLRDHAHSETTAYQPRWPLQDESMLQVAVFLLALLVVMPKGLTLKWTKEQGKKKVVALALAVVILWLIGAVWLKEREGSVDENFTTLPSSALSLAMSIGAKLPFPVPWQTPEPTTPGGKEALRYFTWMNVALLTIVLLPGVKKLIATAKEVATAAHNATHPPPSGGAGEGKVDDVKP